MDEVDLGEATRPARDENTDSSGDHSEDDDRNAQDQSDDQQEGLSQRLRGSLQRRVTPMVGNLRHSISTSTGVDAKSNARDRLRTAIQRFRNRPDNQEDVDSDDELRQSATQLRSSLATSGLKVIDEDRLILLGHTPLVQPQDDMLFLERMGTVDASTTWTTMRRGDYVRIQCPDVPTQSWLCQVAVDKLFSDSDALPLATPFPGALLTDAVVHYVPRDCLPSQLASEDDAAADGDDVAELRSSVDAWRPSMDDPADSTDDETATSATSTRTTVARDKAAAFYENLKTRKARLRTSSADYKDKLKQVSKEKFAAASQVSKQKLAVASQVSKEKLAVAREASKEKLTVAREASKEKLAVAREASKEKLAVAKEASKEKLAAASVVSKEKLAVASQASREKLAVAGQASKLKMQSWSSSFRAKMAQRNESKPATDASTDAAAIVVAKPVFTIEDEEEDGVDDEDCAPTELVSHKPLDIKREEEQLRREMDDC